jgi:hypothetical protein
MLLLVIVLTIVPSLAFFRQRIDAQAAIENRNVLNPAGLFLQVHTSSARNSPTMLNFYRLIPGTV